MKVLVGGKFNRLHPGHLWFLARAKSLGQLIVVLAHDEHNKRAYARSATERKKALEELRIADKVVVGSPAAFVNVLRKFKPDVIVLGYDQKLPDKSTSDYVKKAKIKIVRLGRHGSYSTRKTAF